MVDLPVWATLLILAAVVGLSFLLGRWLAHSWRMDDYAGRLGIVIGSVAFAIAVCVLLWPPKLGIDLSGGVILVYEIDEAATQRQQEAQEGQVTPISAADIVPYILMRINPSGLADVVVRPYGDDQVEVIIPHVDQAEIDRIKNIISKAGFLEFRIVANPRDHDYIIDAALDEANRGVVQIKDDESKTNGLWSSLGKEQGGVNQGVYRMTPLGSIFRDHDTGEILTDENGNIREEFLPADPQERGELMNRFTAEKGSERAIQEHFESLGIKNIDVLMAADDGYDVRGDDVESVSAGFDERGFPSINFTMKPDGAILFQGLTGENAPDPQTGFKRRLGILMDNQLISAPELRSMIGRNGQITGRFTNEEVEDLVQIIRGGSLPAALSPEPTSESQISPLLGGVTIRQSMLAMAISLAFTLLVMLYYYRFAGVVACFALLANLAMTLALMILLRASFTLPGIAGLILSVGMSVDANILIFERIREELGRGAKMRMAIRNGFARATTTIIDANVTTLIAGVVLYAIGTDLIRGFAVTLILGLLISMFTAVYCSKAIFEIGERRHWYRALYMVQWVRETHFNFLGKRKVAMIASSVVIVLGLVGAAARGVDLLDIDLAGGTSVDVLLTEPLTEAQMREKLEKDKFLAAYHAVVTQDKQSLNSGDPDYASRSAALDEELKTTDFDMTLLGLPGYTDETGRLLETGQAWKIITSFPDVEHLEAVIKNIFREGDGPRLITHRLEFSPPETVAAETDGAKKPATSGATNKKKSDSTSPAATGKTPASATPAPSGEKSTIPAAPPASDPDEAGGDPRSAEPRPPQLPDEGDGARTDLPDSTLLAMAGAGDLLFLAQAAVGQDEPAENAQTPEAEAVEKPETPESASPAPPAGEATSPESAEQEKAAPERGSSKSDLTFRYPMSKEALQFQLVQAAQQAGLDLTADRIKVEIGDQEGKSWSVTLPLPPAQAERVFEQLQTNLADTPVFPSASKIGSKVAANMQQTAVMAMLLSFIGIVIYLWIRFQRVAYGLAAVIATLHDVLITLAVLALSHWLAPFLGILLIENFKISLTVIAAFLTLIGYSINDKIVVFDRIRELRGKSPHISLALVNDAVNQTLSRTILTGGTVLVSLLVIYIFGGQGIRAFAFSLLVGIIVGTYSSIYIGAPVLLWLTEGVKRFPESKPAGAKATAASAEGR